MPPKKKGNKKGNDDWEAGVGEALDPMAAATQDAKDADTAKDAGEEEEGGGGGLMAALKRNKARKQKKGKLVIEDFVEGEDPPDANGTNGTNGEVTPALAEKVPEEANVDDIFAAMPAKGKGGKAKSMKVEEQPGPSVHEDDDDDDDEVGEGGRVLTKKEKEKAKKEREKQRKKEQVCAIYAKNFRMH